MNIKENVSIRKIREDTENNFRSGFFCCEALMRSICDNFELDVPDHVIAMSSGMAVGAGRSGCICAYMQLGERFPTAGTALRYMMPCEGI